MSEFAQCSKSIGRTSLKLVAGELRQQVASVCQISVSEFAQCSKSIGRTSLKLVAGELRQQVASVCQISVSELLSAVNQLEGQGQSVLECC